MSTATSKQTMRGGPRLICSPYFVGAILIMLGIVSVKYWSLSGENSDLFLKVEVLQNQLKSSASNVKILDDNMISKQRALKECEKNYDVLSKSNNDVRKEKDDALAELGEVKQVKQTLQNDIDELHAKQEKCAKDLDSVRLEMDRGNADVIANKDKEIGELSLRIRELENEVAGFKAQLLNRPMHLPRNLGDQEDNELGKGQLHDVNPNAVQIQEKPVVGMQFYTKPDGRHLPLLPRGDPNKPKAKPEFSVGDVNEEMVRKDRERYLREHPNQKDGSAPENPNEDKPEDVAIKDQDDAKEKYLEDEEKEQLKEENDKGDLDNQGLDKTEVKVVEKTTTIMPKESDDTLMNEFKKPLNLDAGEADDNAVPMPNEEDDDQDPDGDKPMDKPERPAGDSPGLKPPKDKNADGDSIDNMAKNLDFQDTLNDQGNQL